MKTDNLQLLHRHRPALPRRFVKPCTLLRASARHCPVATIERLPLLLPSPCALLSARGRRIVLVVVSYDTNNFSKSCVHYKIWLWRTPSKKIVTPLTIPSAHQQVVACGTWLAASSPKHIFFLGSQPLTVSCPVACSLLPCSTRRLARIRIYPTRRTPLQTAVLHSPSRRTPRRRCSLQPSSISQYPTQVAGNNSDPCSTRPGSRWTIRWKFISLIPSSPLESPTHFFSSGANGFCLLIFINFVLNLYIFLNSCSS
jgi:hypothetical protein